jgi:stalled ribosome rescue protein Dom34
MKRRTGIWIDSSKAIIISLEGNKESITEIDSDIENRSHHHGEGKKGTFNGLRHGSNESQFDNKKREQTDYFMDTIIDYVKKSDELYVFGPSGAKTQLKKRILEEHLIAPEKLKAVVTSDKMTVNQMVAQVKEFYNV